MVAKNQRVIFSAFDENPSLLTVPYRIKSRLLASLGDPTRSLALPELWTQILLLPAPKLGVQPWTSLGNKLPSSLGCSIHRQ